MRSHPSVLLSPVAHRHRTTAHTRKPAISLSFVLAHLNYCVVAHEVVGSLYAQLLRNRVIGQDRAFKISVLRWRRRLIVVHKQERGHFPSLITFSCFLVR